MLADASPIPGTHMFVGSDFNLRDTAKIRSNEITHVLFVGDPKEYGEYASNLKPFGVQVRTIEVKQQEPWLFEQIPRAIEFIEDAGRYGGKILIAGGSGTSSAVCVAVAYLMSQMPKPNKPENFYERALQIVQQARARDGIDAVPSLMISLDLMKYNKSLQPNLGLFQYDEY